MTYEHLPNKSGKGCFILKATSLVGIVTLWKIRSFSRML